MNSLTHSCTDSLASFAIFSFGGRTRWIRIRDKKDLLMFQNMIHSSLIHHTFIILAIFATGRNRSCSRTSSSPPPPPVPLPVAVLPAPLLLVVALVALLLVALLLVVLLVALVVLVLLELVLLLLLLLLLTLAIPDEELAFPSGLLIPGTGEGDAALLSAIPNPLRAARGALGLSCSQSRRQEHRQALSHCWSNW